MREHVRELIWGLPHGSVRTTVAAPAESGLLRQLPTWVRKQTISVTDGVQPWHDLQAILALRDLIDRQQADILHMHGAKAALIGRLAALMSNRKPALVCTVHNFVEPANYLVNAAYRHLEQRLASRTDRYITVSDALARQLKERMAIGPDKIVTVYNGLSPLKQQLTRTAARKQLELPEHAVVIGTIARLVPEKGVADLIQAFRFLRKEGVDAWLVIMGDGPQRKELQRSTEDLLDRIRWTGGSARAYRFLKGLDIYIQSSHKEAFGLAVLEAMWSGIPVIATKTGGLPEVVGDEETHGVLVPVHHPEQLSLRLIELQQNREVRQQLAQAGQRRVKQLFSVDRMIADTLAVYHDILSNRRTST
jgi:glycosyltransferase involved in cell wall biosynthesis